VHQNCLSSDVYTIRVARLRGKKKHKHKTTQTKEQKNARDHKTDTHDLYTAFSAPPYNSNKKKQKSWVPLAKRNDIATRVCGDGGQE
jgi:hypothetical protein